MSTVNCNWEQKNKKLQALSRGGVGEEKAKGRKEKATQISLIYFVLSSPGPLASLLRNTYKNKLSKFLQINKAPAQGSMPDHHYSLDHSPIPSFSGQE